MRMQEKPGARAKLFHMKSPRTHPFHLYNSDPAIATYNFGLERAFPQKE